MFWLVTVKWPWSLIVNLFDLAICNFVSVWSKLDPKEGEVEMASKGDDEKSTKSGRGAKSQKKSVGKSVVEETESEGEQKRYTDMTPCELKDTIADLMEKIEKNPGRIGHMHDGVYRRMGDRFLSEAELPSNLHDDEV